MHIVLIKPQIDTTCVEPFSDCRFYENFSKNLTPEQQTDIMARYDAYNEHRDRVLSLKRK